MSHQERVERSLEFDKRIIQLLETSLKKNPNISLAEIGLAAVGGYGRGELFPGSDLDILFLVENENIQIQQFINDILYPLWDENIKIDYSVRTKTETVLTAQEDLKVLLGLLDIRYISGNSDLVKYVENFALNWWRKNFKKSAKQLQLMLNEQHKRAGDLAYLLEPDLKESRGGLRDITVLRAFKLSGEFDFPIERVNLAEEILANVRDSLHKVSTRSRDKLLFQEQDKVAVDLGYNDADSLMSKVSESARTVDYILSHVFNRLDHLKSRRLRTLFSRNQDSKIAKGIIVSQGEVALENGFDLVEDPVLPLRLAATASQLGLPISLTSAMEISRELNLGRGVLSDPWPREAREQLIALIGAGQSMAQVFETLEQEGILYHYLPEWSLVRSLPQRNALHRHTVDRHMLETAICAASYSRRVKRPDLLLVAALFHDIGKGSSEDHSERGSVLIETIAKRIGFNPRDVQVLTMLVREHLLLSATATRRDLDDPATITMVANRISDNLELLHYLSFADGEATGKAAWSDWKAKLVTTLVEKVQRVKAGDSVEVEPIIDQQFPVSDLMVQVEYRRDDMVITVGSIDRTGLLSIVAGVLSFFRLDVRSARTKTINGIAYMRWIVIPDPNAQMPTGDEIKNLIKQALAKKFDLMKKIEDRKRAYRALPTIPVPPATVEIIENLATDASIIEIRSHDRPALLFTIGEAVSQCKVDIRSAIVTTLGAEAIDTLYVTEIYGGALSTSRAEEVRKRIAELL